MGGCYSMGFLVTGVSSLCFVVWGYLVFCFRCGGWPLWASGVVVFFG